MTQLVNHLEASIKREITKAYKQAFGKGPEDTTVKIVNNIVLIRFCGGLSPIEQSLMAFEEGKLIVRRIRDLLMEHSSSYVPIIESLVNTKLDEAGYVFGKKDNAVYLTLVFENDIKLN